MKGEENVRLFQANVYQMDKELDEEQYTSIVANGYVSIVHWPRCSSLRPISLFRSREVLDKPAVKSDAAVTVHGQFAIDPFKATCSTPMARNSSFGSSGFLRFVENKDARVRVARTIWLNT